jgi:hypothetical protein
VACPPARNTCCSLLQSTNTQFDFSCLFSFFPSSYNSQLFTYSLPAFLFIFLFHIVTHLSSFFLYFPLSSLPVFLQSLLSFFPGHRNFFVWTTFLFLLLFALLPRCFHAFTSLCFVTFFFLHLLRQKKILC